MPLFFNDFKFDFSLLDLKYESILKISNDLSLLIFCFAANTLSACPRVFLLMKIISMIVNYLWNN